MIDERLIAIVPPAGGDRIPAATTVSALPGQDGAAAAPALAAGVELRSALALLATRADSASKSSLRRSILMPQRSASWDPGVEVASISDPGLRRNSNQDTLAVVLAHDEPRWRSRGHLFVVADGMGAHAAGELASKMSTDNIPLAYEKAGDVPPPVALRQALEEANEKIHARGQANAEFHGMGTTTSSLLLLPEGAVVGHVGDSRVYRVRQQTIEQLSFDHSLVWEMTAGNPHRTQEVPLLIPRNIITRSLGPNPHVQVDLEGPFPCQVGDTFLLCSDGLSGQVQDDELGAILAALPPSEAARVLVDLANLRGGPDNITLVVVRVSESLAAADGGASAAAVESRSQADRSANTWVTAFGVGAVLACLGAAAALILRGRPLEGLLAAVLGAVTAGALVPRFRKTSSQPAEASGNAQFGRGPYTRQPCADAAVMADRLAQLAEQLREAATGQNWTIRWDEFQRLIETAQAARPDTPLESLRNYARAISHMMQELRDQRSRDAASGG